MVDEKVRQAKLLFVLSNDFGELATAMYMVRGYEFQSIFVMPDRLYAVHRESISCPAYRFGSVLDVTAIIDDAKPDIIFLFSGYLFAINNIFDIGTLKTLVEGLQNFHHRIVTSDPFVGLMSDITASTFSYNHPLKQWLTEHFSTLNLILKNITHLYLVNLKEIAHTRSVSFFNPNIILDPDAVGEHTRSLARWIEVDPAKKRWLFVLSREDYAMQVTRLGQNQFDDMLLGKLHQTALADRHPILVGPQVAIDALQSRNPQIAGLTLVPFCNYDRFMSLLFDAEYVFYWNIFSNSIPARIVNHLPAFFFDSGHMAHAIPSVFEAGVKRYYRSADLAYLDPQKVLKLEDLAPLGEKQRDDMAEAIENFKRSPTPEKMVEEILQT